MKFFVKNFFLEHQQTDCIVLNFFESYKFSHSLNYLDRISNGYISNFIQLEKQKGKVGDTFIIHNAPNIVSKRILLVGCGVKNAINKIHLKKIVTNILIELKKMEVKNVIFSLNELNLCIEKNMYWIVRCIVLYIQERLYKIVKLYRKKNKENTFQNVILHIFDKKDLSVSKIALQDALAINHGISSAKNISNLPPNICNPLYLSRKALKLSEKYKNNIVVDIIDIKKMKELGMNAYVAVGSGAKNKPYMSIIKYTGDTCTNDKKIILIGKGVTFDSGGISIKPATDMHEMKYDMCGAASVYGILIAALKLHLPLKIIGILAGCENMISSSSFRPGDVIKTMSGKTIEVLNTDAEGRLVLCDVLKYVEKFSPDIVIDIATLTGACVTALGESISGLFSNNDHLCCQIEQAAKETGDTVWRLPLFKEYKKGLLSSVADLSNIGKSKAGAITAACFLSYFTEKYHWAHLDIAGTAWKSKTFEGATGRPVELLSQFLLNISK